jgi:hypothetical protein
VSDACGTASVCGLWCGLAAVSVMASLGVLAGPGAGWVWDPAGPDAELAAACRELEAGRFGLAAEVLAACRDDFAARTRRSMVMASVAAANDGEAVRHWLREQPDNPDAVLLWARTAAVLALRSPVSAERWPILAVRACDAAAQAAPKDPTPWVARLTLARLGLYARHSVREGWAAYWERHEPFGPREHPDDLDARWRRAVARSLGGHQPHQLVPDRFANNKAEVAAEQLGLMEGRGPWELMLEVWARDPQNREAHHRMLECLSPRFGGSVCAMTEFAAMVATAVPDDHALQLLPLAARVEQFRATGEAKWLDNRVCVDAYFHWFAPLHRIGGPLPVADCSLLAHALYMAGERAYAGAVVAAMSPYASAYPWSITDPRGDGTAAFTRAARALHVPTPRRLSNWERRVLTG